MSLHPPREASRSTPDGIIVSKYPDVCRSPTAPVPYTIVAYQNDDANTASSVFMTGQRAHKQNSFVTRCIGDEPGTGLGVVSNTVSSVCHRKEHSGTVRIEGQWATRHNDEWWMNNRNTTGRLIWIRHNKMFDPTPPFAEYGGGSSSPDEGRVMSDAPSAESLVMGAQYASNAAAALPAQAMQYRGGAMPVQARGGAAPQQVPRPQPQPNPQPQKPPTPVGSPANDNNRPSRWQRWWRWVRNGFKSGAAARTARAGAGAVASPVGAGVATGGILYGGLAGGVSYLGLRHYQTTMNNGVRQSMGLAPRPTTPFGFSSYEIKPLSSFAPQAKKADEEDHSPAPNGRTAEGLSIEQQEEEKRRRRCRVLPYGALRGTCGANEQAHHIVPDYTLRYGTREEGAKGLKRIGDGNGYRRGIPPFPGFLEGPAICLTGNARDNGTEHWEAHGADRVIAAAGAKPGDINPVGTATIGRIKRAAVDHTSNARRECEAEIRAAIAAAFPSVYDNRLGRTTESLPTGDALDWLKQGTSMTRH